MERSAAAAWHGRRAPRGASRAGPGDGTHPHSALWLRAGKRLCPAASCRSCARPGTRAPRPRLRGPSPSRRSSRPGGWTILPLCHGSRGAQVRSARRLGGLAGGRTGSRRPWPSRPASPRESKTSAAASSGRHPRFPTGARCGRGSSSADAGVSGTRNPRLPRGPHELLSRHTRISIRVGANDVADAVPDPRALEGVVFATALRSPAPPNPLVPVRLLAATRRAWPVSGRSPPAATRGEDPAPLPAHGAWKESAARGRLPPPATTPTRVRCRCPAAVRGGAQGAAAGKARRTVQRPTTLAARGHSPPHRPRGPWVASTAMCATSTSHMTPCVAAAGRHGPDRG